MQEVASQLLSHHSLPPKYDYLSSPRLQVGLPKVFK